MLAYVTMKAFEVIPYIFDPFSSIVATTMSAFPEGESLMGLYLYHEPGIFLFQRLQLSRSKVILRGFGWFHFPHRQDEAVE